MTDLTDRITEVLRDHMVCACGNSGEDMECCRYVAERVAEAIIGMTVQVRGAGG